MSSRFDAPEPINDVLSSDEEHVIDSDCTHPTSDEHHPMKKVIFGLRDGGRFMVKSGHSLLLSLVTFFINGLLL